MDLRGARGFNEIPRGVAGGFLDIYVTLVLGLFILWRLVHKGRGLAFAAVRDDEIAAEAVGIDTTGTKVAAFVVSSFLAGIAGGLYAFKMGAINDVAFDVSHSFDYVVMVILGGNGNILGAAVAAMLLTYLNDRLRAFETWRPVAYSFALIWIMVSRLPGLAGKAIEKLRPSNPSISDKAATNYDVKSLGFLARAADGRPILSARDMTIRFGGLVAVDSVNLAILAGESVGLIGPNGAGKSTIFNAITGIYRPSSGHDGNLGTGDRFQASASTGGDGRGPHVPEHPAILGIVGARKHPGGRLEPSRRRDGIGLLPDRAGSQSRGDHQSRGEGVGRGPRTVGTGGHAGRVTPVCVPATPGDRPGAGDRPEAPAAGRARGRDESAARSAS